MLRVVRAIGMSEITEMGGEKLFDWLFSRETAPKFFILDVRNPDEVERWKVEGALDVPHVAVPYFDFIDDDKAALAQVPTDLGLAVVVCATGDSSDFVAGVMREAGRPAANLLGGMLGWGDLHVAVPVPLDGDEKFELWQINRYGKGCLSYVVVAGGEAAVVDPSRFVGFYESFASKRGAKIVEVLETHVHADHISGGPQLAKQVGARYRVLNAHGDEPTFGVDVSSLDDVEIRLGGEGGVSILARALKTPGHTPGSTSYLVDGKWLLSGDTLFVKGVGRPDLGGQAESWGRALFDTLHNVLAKLPDDIELLPAHFGCKSEADETGLVRGTLGALRAAAPEFEIADAEAFVASMKAGVKPPPDTYEDIVRTNLGLKTPTAEEAAEWELGRNECAVSAGKPSLAQASA